MNPFLTVITRHMDTRPNMLSVNQASLRDQIDTDYEQLLVIDHEAAGVEASYANLPELCEWIRGEYVFLLDDDDRVIDREFISRLKLAAFNRPELIMIRMRHQPELILPDDAHWQREPVIGYFGCSSYVVRRDVWCENVKEFQPVYHGDFTFISAVYPKCKSVVWLDRVMTATQCGHHNGQPESLDTLA